MLEFHSEDETGEGWGDDHPALVSLIGVQAELARGDLRPLYLAWLAGAYPIDDRTRAGVKAGSPYSPITANGRGPTSRT